jgi:hypothetical protein
MVGLLLSAGVRVVVSGENNGVNYGFGCFQKAVGVLSRQREIRGAER